MKSRRVSVHDPLETCQRRWFESGPVDHNLITYRRVRSAVRAAVSPQGAHLENRQLYISLGNNVTVVGGSNPSPLTKKMK